MGRPRSDPHHPTFTVRQQAIVRLIAHGLTNAEIGERLHISPHTAKSHVAALRTKLRINTRREIPAAYLAATGESPYPTKKEVAQK